MLTLELIYVPVDPHGRPDKKTDMCQAYTLYRKTLKNIGNML